MEQPGSTIGPGGYNYMRHIQSYKQTFDGKKLRKSITRKAVDYNSTLLYYVHNRIYFKKSKEYPSLQDNGAFVKYMLPPKGLSDCPMSSITGQLCRISLNQIKHAILSVIWTPEGRRLITGNKNGEFTLWNGLYFNFEQLLQAHESSIHCMAWTHNGDVMIAGDNGGYVRYWHPNMNNVGEIYAHEKEPVRGLAFSPTDVKFVSCSDNSVIKIWDFYTRKETNKLVGHGWDVRCVDWHPQSSLVASGSKDNLIKIWDARTTDNIATLADHNKHVLKVKWNKNGNWLLSASGDHQLKLFDVRTMKELQSFKGHEKEVFSAAWHPVHEGFFCSGGSDGKILFWNEGTEEPVDKVEHDASTPVFDLSWHPLGHVLCSGGYDKSTKFWCRNRPGEPYQRAKHGDLTEEEEYEDMDMM